jgi:uncharacterized phage-associated protein
MRYSSLHVANKIIDLAHQEKKSLSPLKLIKLVYICHGWCLALNNRPLIFEDVMAWKYGPVIPELYREIKKYRANDISEKIELNDNMIIAEDDKSLIEEVYHKYSRFSAVELSAMTHKKDSPWHLIWHRNNWGIIPNKEIKHYYEKLLNSAYDK